MLWSVLVSHSHGPASSSGPGMWGTSSALPSHVPHTREAWGWDLTSGSCTAFLDQLQTTGPQNSQPAGHLPRSTPQVGYPGGVPVAVAALRASWGEGGLRRPALNSCGSVVQVWELERVRRQGPEDRSVAIQCLDLSAEPGRVSGAGAVRGHLSLTSRFRQ